MSNYAPKNSVWSAMEYKPPRGRCNFKNSLLSGTCTCLRFMLHPVKAATSFDCDGCGHHASFHLLENTAEDVVLKKWSEQEVQDAGTTAGASKKRRRIAAKAADPLEVVEADGDEAGVPRVGASSRNRGLSQQVPASSHQVSRLPSK